MAVLREAFPPPNDPNMSVAEKQRKLSRAFQGLSALNASDCPEDVQLEFKKYVSVMGESADFWAKWPGSGEGRPDDPSKYSENKEKAAALGNEFRQESENFRLVGNRYTTKQ
jgi:hypothetical protein